MEPKTDQEQHPEAEISNPTSDGFVGNVSDFPVLSPIMFGQKQDIKKIALESNRANKEDVKKTSFAAAMKGIHQVPNFEESIPVREASIVEGDFVIEISEAEVLQLQKPFNSSLVAKFQHSRADLLSFRSFLKSRFVHCGEIFLGALDSKHILIRFEKENDFVQTYAMGDFKLRDSWVSITRWSPYFRPNLRTSIVPVWIGLPSLNIHLHNPGVIKSIVNIIGRYICVDKDVVNFTRPSYLRVYVEIDLLKPPIPFIWIKNGTQIIKQKIVYERVPKFCQQCCVLGHNADECKGRKNAGEDLQGKREEDKVWKEKISDKGKQAQMEEHQSEQQSQGIYKTPSMQKHTSERIPEQQQHIVVFPNENSPIQQHDDGEKSKQHQILLSEYVEDNQQQQKSHLFLNQMPQIDALIVNDGDGRQLTNEISAPFPSKPRFFHPPEKISNDDEWKTVSYKKKGKKNSDSEIKSQSNPQQEESTHQEGQILVKETEINVQQQLSLDKSERQQKSSSVGEGKKVMEMSKATFLYNLQQDSLRIQKNLEKKMEEKDAWSVLQRKNIRQTPQQPSDDEMAEGQIKLRSPKFRKAKGKGRKQYSFEI